MTAQPDPAIMLNAAKGAAPAIVCGGMFMIGEPIAITARRRIHNRNAQARRGLHSSPACCPEPLVRGVPDGRHHSRYS
jgi:hypothetical protein